MLLLPFPLLFVIPRDFAAVVTVVVVCVYVVILSGAKNPCILLLPLHFPFRTSYPLMQHRISHLHPTYPKNTSKTKCQAPNPSNPNKQNKIAIA